MNYNEPWGVWHSVPEGMSADIHDCEENHIGTTMSNEVADRAEACVNAFANIDSPAAYMESAQKLVEAAKRVIVTIGRSDSVICKGDIIENLESALAAVEKGE